MIYSVEEKCIPDCQTRVFIVPHAVSSRSKLASIDRSLNPWNLQRELSFHVEVRIVEAKNPGFDQRPADLVGYRPDSGVRHSRV